MNQWSDEYLTIYQVTSTNITLVIAQGAYTIGVTGTPSIAQTRPPRIEMGPGAASVVISSVTTLINVVSAAEWRGIESIASGAGTPDTLFYDPQYPLGVLNLAPVPDAVGTVTFGAWAPLRSFASLTLPSVTLAAGAEEALKTNLTVALKPYFRDAALDPVIAALAVQSKSMLQQTNLTSRALLGRGPRVQAQRASQ